MDTIGREGLALAVFVLAAVLLLLPVVGADAGCGELELAEIGGDVVADDLPVPLDSGVRQPQARCPVIGLDGEGGHLAEELLVLRLLLQRLGECGLCFFEVGEPTTGDSLLAQLWLLGVDEHINLEFPPLALAGLVVAERSLVPGAETTLLLLTPHRSHRHRMGS